MSHEIKYLDFPGDMTIEQLQTACDDYSRRESEYHCALYSPLVEISGECMDYDAARALIKSHDGDYKQLAVKYCEYKMIPNKKSQEYAQRAKEAEEKKYLYSKMHSVTSQKAEFVGCKNCGSKISRKYLRNDYCPVCHKDMRSASTLLTLEKLDLKIKKLWDLSYEMKTSSNFEIRWLVKIEYHT